MQNTPVTIPTESSASETFKRMTNLLEHIVYSDGGEEKVLFRTPMLTRDEIVNSWEKLQTCIAGSVGEKAANGISCNIICNPGLNIPKKLIRELDDATANKIIDILAPAADVNKTATQYRALLTRVFGLQDIEASQINRSEFNIGKSNSAPIAYSFRFTKKQNVKDMLQPSIAHLFNMALSEKLFHSTRMKGTLNLPTTDTVIIWIKESDVERLIQNPNIEKLPQVFAAYNGNDASPKAPGALGKSVWKKLLPQAKK